jgi:hypothetical protein
MERDDELGAMFDQADQQAQDYEERERLAEEALDEAKAKGVSKESLIVLARETGCTRWALQQSLKGTA